MYSLGNFHLLLGEVIMYCQCIEHDVKWIYAGMAKGDLYKNFDELEKRKYTLGKTVSELQELDNSDSDPYLSKEDYKLLNEITSIRNFWVHKSYITFMYKSGGDWQKQFDMLYSKLQSQRNRLSSLAKSIESVRLEILRRYGRI